MEVGQGFAKTETTEDCSLIQDIQGVGSWTGEGERNNLIFWGMEMNIQTLVRINH